MIGHRILTVQMYGDCLYPLATSNSDQVQPAV